MLLNPPARRRVCYRNLLLVTLFGGQTKPDCGDLLHNLISFFENFDGKMFMDGIDFCVQLKLKYVVVDAVMRALLVNQTQFNGRYGCTQSVIVREQAKTKAVWIYPFQRQGWPVRTLEGRKHNLDLKPSPLHPILGLKGLYFLCSNAAIAWIFLVMWIFGQAAVAMHFFVIDVFPYSQKNILLAFLKC